MKKTVLITGASGGIGAELCRFFIKHNYTVIGIYFSDYTSIQNLSYELGNDFHYYKCDLSNFESTHELISDITKGELHLDILINNAGISFVGLLQELTKNDWDTLWNTNVTSMISLSKEIIPIFLKNGTGKIVNISSVWGNCGASCEVAYSATKGAVNSFTKALAKELAPSNIQVNAISCGIIDTKMNRHLSDEDFSNIIEEIPAGRIGTPSDIAQAVFSIINAGSYLTGQIITVDGGWTV